MYGTAVLVGYAILAVCMIATTARRRLDVCYKKLVLSKNNVNSFCYIFKVYIYVPIYSIPYSGDIYLIRYRHIKLEKVLDSS